MPDPAAVREGVGDRRITTRPSSPTCSLRALGATRPERRLASKATAPATSQVNMTSISGYSRYAVPSARLSLARLRRDALALPSQMSVPLLYRSASSFRSIREQVDSLNSRKFSTNSDHSITSYRGTNKNYKRTKCHRDSTQQHRAIYTCAETTETCTR